MILYAKLFKPRKTSARWFRFTEGYPAIASIIAITGLLWICFSIAPILDAAEKKGRGELIETIGTVGTSGMVDKALTLRDVYHNLFPAEIRELVSGLYSNIALYLVIPFLLLLEFLFPCKPSQPLIGKGFLQDAVWFVALAPAKVFVLFPVTLLLRNLFDDHLSFLVIDSAAAWPVWLTVIAALLVGEFFAWFNHYARHKIRTLWLFHAIHHSQKELNVFTDDRAHVVDLVVGSLLTYIPFFIFQVPNLYAVTAIGLFMAIHNRFIHSNVKINLGWLGFVLASPQFHRVHHSAEAAHVDKNFGRSLSFYDYLFGTAYPSRHVYPETGITDPAFPGEEKVRIRNLPANWFMQTLYPFAQIFKKTFSLLRNYFRPAINQHRSPDVTQRGNKKEKEEVQILERVGENVG